MTNSQRIALQADWWPRACRAQGWNADDRALRLRVCAWAVSLGNPSQLELLAAIDSDRQPARWLESTNDLDNGTDIDRVKACLGLLADNLRATGEVGRPEIGRARRLRDVIRDQIKCLGLYLPRPRAYVAEIINDKFNRARRVDALTIRDLTADPIILRDGREIPSQLDQLVMTLGGVLNGSGRGRARLGLRVQAGETLHAMKLRAGVRCDCAQCSRVPVPALPLAEEDWSDFDPELDSARCADPELGPECGEVECPF